MTVLFWLIPIALGMGIVGLLAFLWSMRSGQYDDLDGAAERVLLGQDDRPIMDEIHQRTDSQPPERGM